ncbi:hypothetical protein M8J77_017916 [Diaphorina citri]|nr:hypothetical protein M8J77_017916 [Diaphorina citri]
MCPHIIVGAVDRCRNCILPRQHNTSSIDGVDYVGHSIIGYNLTTRRRYLISSLYVHIEVNLDLEHSTEQPIIFRLIGNNRNSVLGVIQNTISSRSGTSFCRTLFTGDQNEISVAKV